MHVPFNDLDAMETALARKDVAAVIMETIPATYGFPLPVPDYLPGVRALCDRFGSLYIADEVQTGLMRTGEMWGYRRFGVEPDIVVIGKGITGGLYPISCAVVRAPYAEWLTEDGFAHMSTAGGSELGCLVALKTIEILRRPQMRAMVNYISEAMRNGLEDIMKANGDFFVGIRQCGLVIGLEFDHPEGAKPVMRRLYENGVWAIFSTLDARVLQFKPGLLMSAVLCEEVLERVDRSVAQARADCLGRPRRRARRAA